MNYLSLPFYFLGKFWFIRFRDIEGDTLEIATDHESEATKNIPKTLESWTYSRRNYIRDWNNGRLIDDKRKCFLVEVVSIAMNTQPESKLTMIVSTHA